MGDPTQTTQDNSWVPLAIAPLLAGLQNMRRQKKGSLEGACYRVWHAVVCHGISRCCCNYILPMRHAINAFCQLDSILVGGAGASKSTSGDHFRKDPSMGSYLVPGIAYSPSLKALFVRAAPLINLDIPHNLCTMNAAHVPAAS